MGTSIGGIAGGLFGGSTPSAPNVQTYQPTGTAAFDQLFQNLLTPQSNNNPYSTYTPQAVQTFNQQYNNPAAAGYQTAANNAGAAYGTTGNNAVAASGQINNAAMQALPAATQTLNMGFDPQSALYKQTLQQLNDQVNANSASRGITNSPYGASVANSADSTFNIDWQNNQLSSALQALSGYTGAVTSAGNSATTAGALGSNGAAALNNAGAVPFNATNTIAGNQSTALNQLLSIIGSGSQGYTDNNLSQLMSYLQLGASQSKAQAELTIQNYANQLAASQASQKGAGTLGSSLTNLANNPAVNSAVTAAFA